MAAPLLNTIFEFVDFVFDLSETIDRTRQLSKPDIVQVPPDPKPLSPAARRALAEAEERERRREQSDQAASASDQAPQP
ncbi:hypothetical protein AOQ72_08340 [Bradyrhizobium yuanmingense]|uniref:Uncharacterized protein n=1 Tax=Bradyrhizobium yuanmingense TaxID=108015 RepID=A0A0R3CZ97_9BRAD|nr:MULTISPECIES: hypothetical protein [Bradyrhizobium]KRQ01470.1 hypothetical protein AOQ72_08340 [Bradyrhizobium yuanmingense]MCA1392331.1 hypothetical protein [Bradyrhizobium sp. IC3123]MCA1550758.1 hypothetical protein [Bradyrhizobium sp. BRP19]